MTRISRSYRQSWKPKPFFFKSYWREEIKKIIKQWFLILSRHQNLRVTFEHVVSEHFWILVLKKAEMRNGWVNSKSMGEINIFWRLLLCFEKAFSTCVFGRPAVFYELRIQPFLLFLNVKNCCSPATEAILKTTFWPIFFLSFPLVNHAALLLQHWKINRV